MDPESRVEWEADRASGTVQARAFGVGHPRGADGRHTGARGDGGGRRGRAPEAGSMPEPERTEPEAVVLPPRPSLSRHFDHPSPSSAAGSPASSAAAPRPRRRRPLPEPRRRPSRPSPSRAEPAPDPDRAGAGVRHDRVGDAGRARRGGARARADRRRRGPRGPHRRARHAGAAHHRPFSRCTNTLAGSMLAENSSCNTVRLVPIAAVVPARGVTFSIGASG